MAVKFAATVALLFVLAMIVVVFAVHQTIVNQFTAQYTQSIQTTVGSIQQELASRHETIRNQLQELADKLRNDNEFRLQAAVLEQYQQQYVVDYAQNFMATMGLQALEILNAQGVVLSSGHYRNAFGANDSSLVRHLKATGSGMSLAWFTSTTGQFICLTSIDSVTVGEDAFYLIGGVEVTKTFLKNLQPNPEDMLILQGNGSIIAQSADDIDPATLSYISAESRTPLRPALISQDYSIGGFSIPEINGDSISPSSLVLIRPTRELTMLLDRLRTQIFTIAILGVIIVIGVTVWRINAVAQPLQELAGKAEQLSLDQLDVTFNTKSNDEVGILNNALQNMVQRLRQSRIQLASAEQKAAMGEISRQVNHDIKNGFIPIRNVMNHWQEVAQDTPEELPQIFHERKSTVIESLNYLENLTRNYSRLQPKTDVKPVNINHLVQLLITTYESLPDQQYNFSLELASTSPWVMADEIQLRRAFENILRNAMDAMGETGGIQVTIARENNRVHLFWTDTGPGIPKDIQGQLFRMNVSTKSDGSGLGLANVKRIIEDFDGSIAIESEEGQGTTVKITLPLTSKVEEESGTD